MTIKKRGLLEKSETQAQIDNNAFAWHCYLCGHTWIPHDRTNANPSDFKCAACDRYEFNKRKFIGHHDPNCVRCLKKKREELELLEKLQEA
jgi:hypothetical protein